MRISSFIIVSLLVAALVLSACSQGDVQAVVRGDPRVQAFLGLFPEAKYVQTAYAGDQVETVRDIVQQDCGAVPLPSSLVRATFVAKAATLVAYVDGNGTIFCVASKVNQNALTIRKGDPATVPNGTLVTVNGEPINFSQFRAAAALLSPAVRNQTTVAALLNQLIDQALLRQAAAGFTVSDADVAAAAEQAWRAAGFTSKEAFTAALTQQGGSYDTYLTGIREQVKVQRLLSREGVTSVNVSAEAARSYYLNNPNSFLVSEQVRFRQLFISFNQSGSQATAQTRLQTALQQIQKGTNFCDVVRQYSDDTGSRERCGEYTTPRGVLAPELETALFSLGVNQSSVVQSGAGYHVLVVLAHQPTAVIPYSQAEAQVVGLLRNAAVQQRLSIYLLKLRAGADIVDYTS
jgi:parvulin-like peptidyl-prolyl isomerase